MKETYLILFAILLYTSLTICILGSIYRISTWFSRRIGVTAKDYTTTERVSAAAKGILGVIFSAKILTLIKVFILDVVLQRRILKEDFLRWFMHMLIYIGFMLLLFMHALEDFISEPLFTDYYSTINPFMFLRDLFGLMVFIGVGIAVYRRFILKVPRLKTKAMDHYAIIILAVIMISGIMLEGVKITSHTEFQTMVEDYAGLTLEDDPDEMMALESYWVKDFGVVSPNVKAPFDQDVLSQGQEIHEESCMECHSSPQWAFTGYAFAKISKPIALALDRADASNILWYIHFLACFFGLAYLPFSKMFHIFSTPISLLANAVMEKGKSDPANIATRQAMELDACMHCGTCSLRCSARTAFDALGNEYILPAEKMASLKTLAAGKEISLQKLRAIQEGVYLCTNCDRCTLICPAGINLKEFWFSVREELIQRGYPEPLTLSQFSLVRGLNRENLTPDDYRKPLERAKQVLTGNFDLVKKQTTPFSLKGGKIIGLNRFPSAKTFSYCFGCQNCTTVCPVVSSYDNPQEALGLLPHQIMYCLRLGLTEMASSPRMLWNCVTCYQCHEDCPQNVKVTELLFQLKNIAVKKAVNTSTENLSDSGTV